MKKSKKCASRTVRTSTKEVNNSLLINHSNADRVRRWHLPHAIGQHFSQFKATADNLIIKRWKDQQLRQVLNGRSISLELRFYFLVLCELIDQRDGWTLGFLTVNFSQALSEKIANEKTRSPAGKYANRINKKFREHGVRALWFGVLEDHKGNLHCHGLIGFHKDDEAKLKQCLKVDTDKDSGIKLQTSYKKRPSPNSHTVTTSKSENCNIFQEANIDIGAADYISKALEKKSDYMEKGKCRIYAPNELRSTAHSRYEEMRSKQNRFRSATFDTTTLNCHQALTYLLKGWVPETIDPGQARLDEQRIIDIDNALAWEHFRNSEPSYDWQYEEDDPSVDAYFDAEQEIAEGLSEGEYDRVVEEAERFIDQSAPTGEMTEGEYDWLMSEIAVIAKEQEKARSLSEGQYEALMQEISSDIEQYRQEELLWQAPTDPAVSDTELEAFMKQQALNVAEKPSITPGQNSSLTLTLTTDTKMALYAMSVVNNPPSQSCIARQINTAYGAHHPPLIAPLNTPYKAQIARLRRLSAWDSSLYRKTKKTPLELPRGVMKLCRRYQMSSLITEWPPPMATTCRS
ncbi:hypothetical protein [Vreelandella alkaliphila]|uniref:Replication protein n=1 Tax=Vreelandella alkaliphila TaxID=272774 RepID=A0AAJ2VPP4_9GAMM|nr:hypothetical protein [Halomonas alkaliphila]MDX5976215.1 hypothetical protein [Halomonas alkaliphila]